MTDISPDIFRAYDIRGVYPDTLDEKAVRQIALAYADLLPEAHTFVVGRDYRGSGPALQEAVVQALREKGRNVIDIGTTATPVFYFAIAHYKHPAGIMITGSHNPKNENGLKLNKNDAFPVYGEIGIYDMRDQIAADKYEDFSAEPTGEVIQFDPLEDYMEDVVGRINLKKPLKVVLDIGNGAGADIPRRVFEKLGCEVTAMYEDPDPDFPNHPADPYIAETLVDLQKEVKKQGADVGFGYDGDADRAGLVDKNGTILTGEQVLHLLTKQALEANDNKGEIVVEVRTSKALIEDLEKQGGDVTITRAGHAYILKEVMERKAIFGGEITGHLYFPYTYYPYDDAIFATAKLAEIVAEKDAEFPAYVESLPKLVASPEIFIDSPDDVKFKAIEKFVELVKEKGYDFLDIDGARVEMENGWALVRASNTTPTIKVRFEADTEENLKQIMDEIGALMKEAGIELQKE
ncbi:phosphomannomutase/phosphoglucomutase [Patescibacteria group bacterium]